MSTHQLATVQEHRAQLVQFIQDKLPDVRNALPPNTVEAERLEVAFRTALNKNPKLAECTNMSVCAALVNCATLGLVPNTPEQHAYLIPRKNKDGVLECNLEIGYRGFSHLILRGGLVSHIDSDVIRKGDSYELQKGDPVVCWFRPNLETPNRESQPIIAAYCLIVFKDGNKKLEVMDGGDLAKMERAMMRQNFDKATPAWKEWRSEMLRKGPIKRIAKTSNLGPIVSKAAELDNAQFTKVHVSESKPITLPGGETVTALPRHGERESLVLDPVNEKGEFIF
jgi:recombination protein RecT